jgi:DNA-binding NtrC family response regulator
MVPSIVVLARNPEIAQSLAGGLRLHFHSVHLTNSCDEFRKTVASSRPEAVVLDIEQSRLSDVESLHHDFPELPIVCTHRIPDEEMWRAALEVGASDVCAADDVANVLTSVLRNVTRTRIAAA